MHLQSAAGPRHTLASRREAALGFPQNGIMKNDHTLQRISRRSVQLRTIPLRTAEIPPVNGCL